MTFKELLHTAKQGDGQSVEMLLGMYKPLLVKGSIINGRFDEDLYQEQCITLLKCIELFRL